MRYFYSFILIFISILLESCLKHKEQFELPTVLNKSDQIAVASNPSAPSLYLGTLPFYSEVDITEQFFMENNVILNINNDSAQTLSSIAGINQFEIFIDSRSPVRYSCNQCDIYSFSFFPIYFVNNTNEHLPFVHYKNKVAAYLEFQNDYHEEWITKQLMGEFEVSKPTYALIPPKHFSVVLIPYYRTNNALLRVRVEMVDQIIYSHLFTLSI